MKTENTDAVRIFTDGSSRGNPGRGGWGSIVVYGDKVAEIGGAELHTTNNKMELNAVLQGLQYLQQVGIKRVHVIVYTDSAYVVNGMTKWVEGWQRNGWKTKDNRDVLNRELWEALVGVRTQFDLGWKRLPGHAGIPANERCDEIATLYADGRDPELYEGPADAYPVSLGVVIDESKVAVKKKRTGKAYSYVSLVGGEIKTHGGWADCERRVHGAKNAKYKKALSEAEEKKLIEEWTGML